MSTSFNCGHWAGRSVDACEADYGRDVHGRRPDGTWVNTHGCAFRQLPDDVPWLRPFYSDLELRFNSIPYVCWTSHNWHLAVGVCAAYVVLVFGGQALMSSMKLKFDLKGPLRAWNLLLSIFSLIGFLRTLPHLAYYVLSDERGLAHGFYASLCRPAETSFGQGANGLWTMLFIFSKVPELVDTAFVVLRGQKLLFLHWYHHVTVLLYCWHSYMTRSSAGLYFVAMNFGVHALMYFYYFLAAGIERPKLPAGAVPKKGGGGGGIWWAPVVTFLQISQMFVGVVVCVSVYLYQRAGMMCDMTDSNFVAGGLMYLSYFVLFFVFAMEKYIWPTPTKRTAPKAD